MSNQGFEFRGHEAKADIVLAVPGVRAVPQRHGHQQRVARDGDHGPQLQIGDLDVGGAGRRRVVRRRIVGDSYDRVATVGQATIEAEVLDSMTKQRLAAAVDQQAGKKAFTQLKTWSDVKAACEHWAKALRERLIQEGVRQKA